MLPDKDAISTFGQPRVNRRAVDDPTTDVGAEHFNPIINDISMLTVLSKRVWCAFHYTLTSTMVIDSHDEMWNGVSGYAIPVLTRTGAGVYTVTYPTSVADFVGAAYPGGTATPHNVSLRFGGGQARSTSGTAYSIVVVAVANILTVYLSTGGVLADAANLVIDVWAC